jgi:16S rRNA (cytosine1402-N4)-methyltransferase
MTTSESDAYHRPVLAAEVVGLLVTDREGAYLDLTAGGGGHLKALAETIGARGRLYGIDKDPEAVAQAARTLQVYTQFRTIVQSAFADVTRMVERFPDRVFDGVLLDLGVSSHQIDQAHRGFSFRYEGPLDMRFDPSAGPSAANLINSLDEKRIESILRDFGEERQSVRIAKAIVRERRKQMILTTQQLADIVRHEILPPHQTKSLARVFQAFRIAVNRELEQLADVLPAALSILKPGGRLAIISYHSLEDRTVKRFFQARSRRGCTCPPEFPVCVCGQNPQLKLITRKPVTAGVDERRDNPRSRSAKLRVAEKL